MWNLTPHGREIFTFRRSRKYSYSAREVEAAGVAGMLVIVYQTKNEITTFRLKKGLANSSEILMLSTRSPGSTSQENITIRSKICATGNPTSRIFI
jgi:hypothetical protein